MRSLKYSAEWRNDAANASEEERATLADLRLIVGGENVTMHLSGEVAIDHITVPLYGVAEGLAHDWWTLFGARDGALSLVRYRDGFRLPDVRMSYDGAAFEIWAEQRAWLSPDIRFWGGPREIMDRATAEDQLKALIEDTLARLSSRGLVETSAALRWKRVLASGADPEEAAYCEAAGALRVDPYAIDEESARTIESSARLFVGEPLAEFLAGARTVDASSLIEWIAAVERRSPETSLAPALSEAADASSEGALEGSDPRGWAVGYRAARAFRARLGLGPERRFATYGELAAALGASAKFAPAPANAGVRLIRTVADDGVHLHLRSHGRTDVANASQLFALARGVGDALCFPGTRRSAVNDLRSAHRQAASRAFAAEFLAPIAEIRSMSEDGYDLVAIAGEFAVSSEVVERQLENAERIESACA